MNKTKHMKREEPGQIGHLISCGGSAFGRWGNSCPLDLHTTCLAPVAVALLDSWFW